MAVLIQDIGPDATPSERYQACHNAEPQILHCPISTLSDIYAAAVDLTIARAPLDARHAGFAILSGLLGHPDAPEDLRVQCLRSAVTLVEPKGIEHQFRVFESALKAPLGLGSQAETISEYSLQQLIPQFEAQNAARKRIRSETRGGGGKDTSPEEHGMDSILGFLAEFISECPEAFPEYKLTRLFNLILSVAEKALATGTVEHVCLIIRSIILVSRIPSNVLQRCLEDLCAIYNTTQRLKDVTWKCLELLLKSEHQDENEIVTIVLDTIGLPPQERQSHTVCGAIRTARFLISHQNEPHIPPLTFDRFLAALSKVNFGSRRIRKEVLRAIALLLASPSTASLAVQISDWGPLFDIISRAINKRKRGARTRQSIDTVGSEDHDPSDVNEPTAKITSAEDVSSDQIGHIADALAKLWPQCSQDQHLHVSNFFLDFENILSDGFLVRFVLELSDNADSRISASNEHNSQTELVEHFGLGSLASSELRCAVIQAIKASFLKLADGTDTTPLHQLVLKLLNDFQSHKDLYVGNCLADLILAESKVSTTTHQQLQESFELIWPLLSVPDDLVAAENTSATANSTTGSLVELFLHSMAQRPESAVGVYNILVPISNAQHLPSSARLPAVRLLTRIRCDLHHRILVLDAPDIQGLAATLCRTESTIPDRSSTPSARHYAMVADEKNEGRTSRVSGVSSKTQSTLRSTPRSSTRIDKIIKPRPPLWLYPGGPALPISPSSTPSDCLHIYSPGRSREISVHVGDWLANAISILQQPHTDWEIYSYVIVHLPAQLSNRELFTSSFPHIRMLRRILVDQLLGGNVYEPPHDTGVRKGDVALCLYHALMMLVGYSDQAEREEQERIVQSFVDGVTKWERTARFCIQSLTICCLVVPAAVTNWLSAILQRISQMITQSHLAVDILEFLANLARHRKIYVNFREEEYRTVFAVCVRYLEHSREQRLRLLTPGDRATFTPTTHDSGTTETRTKGKPDLNEDLPQYVFSLAYHVLTVWFLAVKIGDRNDHVGWITKNLAWKDASGGEIMEEQSQATLDMMMRTAYLNLGETATPEPFAHKDGRVLSKTWLLGLSIVTIETATTTGVSRVTKRQASGTTYSVYRPQTIDMPPHQEASPEEERGSDMGINIFPNHVLLQLMSSVAPTPSPMEAICLPEEDAVKRALTTFDRNDTVDGYKVGVIYLGNRQTTEVPILANTAGSPAFETFLSNLGTKVELNGATFNTQGLDRAGGTDGQHTYAWRDRVTEIVFHVPTMMPTDLTNDPYCVNKKRHIGNDYVNIIWNESGHPFRFDTFASQFNCVNIVIVPDGLLVPESDSEANAYHEAFGQDKEPYYTVQVLTKDDYPELSPVASYKLLPLKVLPLLTRQLALQASVFSNVWTNRQTGEHASSWRTRLRAIKQLRKRYANTGTSTSAKYPGAKSRTNYETGDTFQGRVVMGGIAELGEDLVASLDFSRWAGPNAYNYGD